MHILSFIHLVVFVFRIEEKLEARLVYSSFRRVATRGFRTIPSPSVVEVEWGRLCSNEKWTQNHSVFTTTLQHGIVIGMIATSPD